MSKANLESKNTLQKEPKDFANLSEYLLSLSRTVKMMEPFTRPQAGSDGSNQAAQGPRIDLFDLKQTLKQLPIDQLQVEAQRIESN